MNTTTSEGTTSARQILKIIPERDTKSLLRHASKLFDVEGVPASTRLHNRRQWAKSVQMLGDKWVLTPQKEGAQT